LSELKLNKASNHSVIPNSPSTSTHPYRRHAAHFIAFHRSRPWRQYDDEDKHCGQLHSSYLPQEDPTVRTPELPRLPESRAAQDAQASQRLMRRLTFRIFNHAVREEKLGIARCQPSLFAEIEVLAGLK